jgi:hypothetical protein
MTRGGCRAGRREASEKRDLKPNPVLDWVDGSRWYFDMVEENEW